MAFAQDQFDLASLRFDRPSRCLQVLRNHGDRQELHIVRRRHVCRSNTRIPAPSEHHVRIQPAGKRNRRHRTTRLKRLLHDLALERQRIIPRSSPSTCQNSVRQNLMGTSAPHRAKKTSNSRHPSRAARPDAYGRMALCRPLLRPRPGREPDQAAQGPARLRPHQLPGRHRQPDAARPSHRRLLAGPRGARRHPQDPCPRQGRVHHDPAPASQDRRPRHRDRQPGPHRLCQRLPGRRPLPTPGRFDQARRTLSSGASGPPPIRSASPTRAPAQPTTR